MSDLHHDPGPLHDSAAGAGSGQSRPAADGFTIERLQLQAPAALLLLPVRIETRFSDEGEAPELWVRVYPDQIAVDTHEDALTAGEIAAGQAYWDAVWRAGVPPANIEEVKGAWRALALAYGPPRAAWVALQMTPKNIAQQPAQPTAAGAQPVPPPDYPQPAQRNSSWEKTPEAMALPDRWVVVTYFQGVATTSLGGPIAQSLAIGPTPGATSFPDGLPVDAGIRWLVDFQAALDAGMALRIPLSAEQRQVGFERIIVYGLRGLDQPPSLGVQTMAHLFTAHHYTDGLALVPQGSPTNNTADASSAFQRTDPDYEVSFAVERQGPLPQDNSCDGSLLARVLSLPRELFDHVRYSELHDNLNAYHTMRAFWPATLGYFLNVMMADALSPAQIERIRSYTLAYVRPRGPLPAFRIGTTPYGILPVTSLRQWQPHLDEITEPGLVDFLRKAWPIWLASSSSAPQAGGTNDPDQDLAGILGMDASSMQYRGRYVLGDDFVWNLFNWILLFWENPQPWWDLHRIEGRQLLDSFGYTAINPRVLNTSYQPQSFPIPYPTVQDGPLSEAEPLKNDATVNHTQVNYIAWLNSATIDDIRNENYPGPNPNAILYQVLRFSVLQEYATLARQAQIDDGTLPPTLPLEPEIVNIAAREQTVTPWVILNNPVSTHPELTWAAYLHTLQPAPGSPFASLGELRESLAHLAQLPTAELDRLLTETLDVASHRLDAWVTAIATGRLQTSGVEKEPLLYTGCFGWVENLRPAAPPPPVVGLEREAAARLDQLRATGSGQATSHAPVLQPHEDNGGFIHAPSITQAAASAVLRNGSLTHRAAPQEGALEIDLSSERVFKALSLLDGVRQGQPLGALLGYRFELGMHQLHLDSYIQPFRDRYPLVAGKLQPSDQPAETVAATNVVDGLALQRAWVAGQLPQGADWGDGLPPAGNDQDAVITLFADLEEMERALSDLSLAESVYQIMLGNFGRAGGILEAVSKGAHAPEPQVVQTPRGGIDLTHRVLTLFAGAPRRADTWKNVHDHPRALAEPWLDAWLSAFLPAPANVACQVTYKDATQGATTKVIRLSDLDVGPLDLLALATAANTAQQSELEMRILFAALPSGASEAQIVYQPEPPLPGAPLTFPDLLFLLRSLNALLGRARALRPQDLIEPERQAEDNGGLVDLTEINARAGAARQALSQTITDLSARLAGLPGSAGAVRAALLAASYFGVPGAIPGADADLGIQGRAVLQELQQRQVTAQATSLPATKPEDAVAVLQAIFGAAFLVLPRLTPPDIATLRQAFGQSSQLLAGDTLAPARWLQQLTHVRPAISQLDEVSVLAQMLAGAGPPTLTIGQLPPVASDRWLALPLNGMQPTRGRIALEAMTFGNYVTDISWCGLLLDEWVERIPNTTESAGVAFHYEGPTAQAPQTLLLAINPTQEGQWNGALIRNILEETMDLYKMRAVDLDSVQAVGQLLPALYFALNLQQETVSVRFAAT